MIRSTNHAIGDLVIAFIGAEVNHIRDKHSLAMILSGRTRLSLSANYIGEVYVYKVLSIKTLVVYNVLETGITNNLTAKEDV